MLFGTVLLMITVIALCVLSQRNIQKYEPSEEVFGNPLMGYAPCAWNAEVREDVSLLYMDVTWAELEPEEGKYNWEEIEKENQLDRWREEGKHIVLRFVCDAAGQQRSMWIFLNGCIKKQTGRNPGMMWNLERDFPRIITRNNLLHTQKSCGSDGRTLGTGWID